MLDKVKGFFKKSAGKVVALSMSCVALIGSAFADTVTPVPPTTAEVETFLSKITDTFTVTYILGIMGSIVVFGIAYVILYWAVRKVLRSGLASVKKGRIRV